MVEVAVEARLTGPLVILFSPLKCQYALHVLQFLTCVRLSSVFLLSSVRISCYLRLK